MKDKHINISADTKLLKLIYREVDDKLQVDKANTARLLLFKFIVYFSLLAWTYSSIITAEHFGSLLVFYILFGLLSVLFGFNFAHDFSHNTVFRNKQLNEFCFIAIYTMVGAHAESWKHRHIHSHHYAPNVKDYDSDLQITNLIRVEPGSPYKWFHRYQHWYAPLIYTTYSLYWVLVKDMVIYFTDRTFPKKRTLRYHFSFWLQKTAYIIYLLVIPILYSGLPWQLIVLAFLVMHLLQSQFLLFTFFMTHHVEKTAYFNAGESGYIATSWINNQIKSSNDFYPFSPLANFIFGGFNNHIAHHLFPHIHHVHYPALNRILYSTLRQNNIEPNVTGFFSGALSHLRHLKNMSVKPCGKTCRNCATCRLTAKWQPGS